MVALNLGVCHYVLDHIYGAFMHRLRLAPPFFSAGWGGPKLELLEKMTKQLVSQGLAEVAAQRWPPKIIQPLWKTVWESKTACLREGIFKTPCDKELLDALPIESYTARVAFLAPKYVPNHNMACVVHLAESTSVLLIWNPLTMSSVPFLYPGQLSMLINNEVQECCILSVPYCCSLCASSICTGDHSFDRRLRLGGPLLKNNIATMVLESPFYGQRRPRLQHGSKLLCVSDLLLLGRVTIEEARTLLYWLETEAGFSKTGVCGLSMGGVHAAMVGSLHPTPVATLPFLAPHSAAVAFCEGILKHGTAWDALRWDEAQKAGMTLEQVRERMRSVLSLTDVTQFPLPKNPPAVIFVAATDDGYIPKHSVLELQRAWPGSEVRWVTGGHVSSFILHNNEFRKAIRDALDRLS
eukprot:Gb_38260 [translate_table: standard]